MYFLLAIAVLFMIVKITNKIVRGTKAVVASSKEAVTTAKATMTNGLGSFRVAAEEKGSATTAKLAAYATTRIEKVDVEKTAAKIDSARAKADTAATEAKAATAKAKAEAKAVVRALRVRAADIARPKPPEVEEF